MLQLLQLISRNSITLLKDLDKHIFIIKEGKFNYKNIPSLQFNGVKNFIDKLEEGQIYTVIPLISMFGKDNDPHIVLSKQLLVTKYSNPQLIYDFLN